MRKRVRNSGNTAPDALHILWKEGFFKKWSAQDKITAELSDRGNNFQHGALRMALRRASYLTDRKQDGVTGYIQKTPAVNKEIDKIESELFENKLVRKFGEPFKTEMLDLQLNFGKSGNCSAFILRKILEKLIYICFAKQGISSKLEDAASPGRLIGLEAMINTAAREKIEGTPFLSSHTAQEVRGIKFLGDASAHNPFTDVDMKTILPQMPYIITAYKELARFL